MNIGRFFCVALPFALTVGSIIFLLVAALAGVADKSLYIFRLNLTNMSIDPANVTNIVSNLSSRDLNTRADVKSDNITAADLGLGNIYDIGLWGYCYKDQKNKQHCTKAKFNWAASALNTSYIENFGSAAGVEIDLPSEITKALKAFTKVSKWTEVAYIIAFVALAIEIVGIFANCSTLVSCCTWVIAGLAAVLVGASAGLSTALAAVVVGAIEATAKYYGVKASINTRFLAVVWISTAFAIGAAMFWVFTICCCKPEHRSRSSRNKNRDSHAEKLLPTTGYAPLNNDHEMSGGNYYNQNQSQSQYGAPRGAPRSDLAYEPYSHRA